MQVSPRASWLQRAALLAAGLLLVPVRATENAADEWWSPALSVAKVYDLWGEDSPAAATAPPLIPLVPRKVWKTKRWSSNLGLILLGEGEARERGMKDFRKAVGEANASAEHHGKTNATAVTAIKVNTTVNGTTAATGEQKQIPQEVRKTWLEWVRMWMSFALIIKAMCMASNIVFQVSPLPVIKEFAAKGCTGETDSAPFISIAYGSCQWCFYGLFAFIVTGKTGFLVLVYSNACGAGLGMYYVYVFATNCTNPEMRMRSNVYFQVLAVVAIVQVMGMMVMDPVRALFFSGLISSAWSIVGSMSMLTTVPIVIRTRCSKTLHLSLLIAAECSAFLWLICGVMLRDPWITVPNVASICTNSFALSLIWYYPRTCVDDEIDEESEEIARLVDELQVAGERHGDREQLVPDHPSPLVRIIRTIRGQELDRSATTTGYGTLKCTTEKGCTAGTGETWD